MNLCHRCKAEVNTVDFVTFEGHCSALCAELTDSERKDDLIESLQKQLAEAHNATMTMLEALDIYWKMSPDHFDTEDPCPYCGKPNKDDWEHDQCFENSWHVFEIARKIVEEQK